MLPRMHLARLRAVKRQPFSAGLDRSRAMRDRSPVLCRGRRPLRGLPVGLSCQAGRPGQLTREGEVPGRED